MKKDLTNYAFIDSQNLYRGFHRLGWKLDWRRFRVYLKEKYAVHTAYQFLGYLPQNEPLYTSLQKAGYVLVHKPVTWQPGGKPKANMDSDLTFQVMLDYPNYEKALIVTSDGDFYRPIKYLYEQGKLEAVLSPEREKCSALLKIAAKERIRFLDRLQKRLEYTASR